MLRVKVQMNCISSCIFFVILISYEIKNSDSTENISSHPMTLDQLKNLLNSRKGEQKENKVRISEQLKQLSEQYHEVRLKCSSIESYFAQRVLSYNLL